MNKQQDKPQSGRRPIVTVAHRNPDTRQRSKVPHGVFLLDRSGPMIDNWDNAKAVWSSFIEEQKKNDGPLNLTLALVDHECHTAFFKKPIKDVTGDELSGLAPRSSFSTLHILDALNRAMEKHPEDTMFVMIIDGPDNISKNSGIEQTRRTITSRKTSGSEFCFLSRDLSAIEMGRSLGGQTSWHTDYDKLSVDGTKRINSNTTNYRSLYVDPSTKEST